jgi:hypothetical protein
MILFPFMILAIGLTAVAIEDKGPVKPQVRYEYPSQYCEWAIIMGKKVYRCQQYGVTHDTDYRVIR